PHARPAARDDPVDQAFGQWRGRQNADTLAAGRLASDRHLVGVAAERGDIVADPFESGDLVEDAVVTRCAVLGFVREFGVREEAEYSQPVVDGDGQDVATSGERLTVVQRQGARAGGEPAAGDVHEHGQLVRAWL